MFIYAKPFALCFFYSFHNFPERVLMLPEIICSVFSWSVHLHVL